MQKNIKRSDKMRKWTYWVIVPACALMTGCHSLKGISQNNIKKTKGTLATNQTFSSYAIINSGLGGVCQASIGDVLINVSEGFNGDSEVVRYSETPVGLRPIPKYSVWTSEYSLKIKDKMCDIYVSPQYYENEVGVILDATGNLVCRFINRLV
jgi:hypothetical protein